MEKFLEIRWFKKLVLLFMIAFIVLLVAKSVTELKHWGDDRNGIQNTISVQGYGEVFAVADIATFSFSVDETGKDVAEAQTKAADKNNAALKYLKSVGIADKDIKTEGYTANPKYDYTQAGQKLLGYQVTQTISVKVRDVSKAGDVLSGIGATGVSNISGLTFVVDNDDSLKEDARSKAIADAKEKAVKLARDLDVSLGKVVNFSENSQEMPRPMYDMMVGKAMGGSVSSVPQLPIGENKVAINVYITYKIK